MSVRVIAVKSKEASDIYHQYTTTGEKKSLPTF